MNAQAFIPFIWPVFALICIVVFRAPLSRLIDRIRGFDVNWQDGNFMLTTAEANEAAQSLLAETTQMIGQLGLPERRLFRRIVQDMERGHTVTLDSLFPPKFQRQDAQGNDTPELTSLRKLRDAQLIRPRRGGQFKDNKAIELKKFGEILLRTHRDKLTE